MNNILINGEEECTGCGTCSIICPTNCIKIEKSKEGFYRSQLDQSKCINCGECKKVCYKYLEVNNSENSINNAKGYLSYSKNQYNRKNSSSGGIGRELSYYALNNGYEVCGVEYDYKNNNVKHTIVNDKKGIDIISKSKYIPSYTEEAFKSLDKNKKYMVFGTPCQIYGLRRYMDNKNFNNLILVDFFCHGAPSLNLWDKYLEMIKSNHNIGNIKNVDFRDKTEGWHKFSMYIEGDNKNFYRKNHFEDEFYEFFLMNLDLDNSCATCKLRFNKIYSDIRLGDFWGSKCEEDEKGISILLSNTQLGDKVLHSLDNIVLEDITFEELKISQYVEKLHIPKECERVKKELQGNKKLDEIYREVIVPIKRKQKVKRIVLFPLRKLRRVVSRIIK